MASIHKPVPGFNPTIHDQVTNYFKALKGDNAFWRANWLLSPMEGITPWEEEVLGSEAAEGERSRVETEDNEEKDTVLSSAPLFSSTMLCRPIKELAVRSEYQTVFKLPRTGCLVFAIHSYIDCLDDLVESPRAAEMIARATENMNSSTLKYRGVNQESKERIVTFLKSVYCGV